MTTTPATISERVPLPALAVPVAEGMGGFAPADLFRIVRSRLVMIVLVFLFFASLASGGFVLWYIRFPLYTAEAIIECIANAPKEQFELAPRQLLEEEHQRFLRSQALYVLQPDLLQEVLRAPEVRGTAWYKALDQEKRLKELVDDLACTPIKDSNYIRLAMGTRSPGDPHIIVQKVVETYLLRVRERATEKYRLEQSDFEREEADIKNQVATKAQQMEDFRKNLPPGAGIDREQGTLTVVEQELISGQTQVTELQLQTLELEGIQSIYDSPEGPGVTPEDQQLVEMNPQVAQLMAQAMAIQQELTAREVRFGSNHREMSNLRTRMVETERQLAQMRNLRLQEAIELKRDQVRTAYLNSQHALLLAQERLIEIQAKQSEIDRQRAVYERLRDELDFLKQTQQKVSDHVRDLKRVVAERAAVQIDVLQTATPPIERSQPQWYFAAAGILMAMALSVGLAVLFDLLDTSVRSPRDVVRYLSVAVLGTIPDADDEEVDIECIERAVRDVPHSMVAEAFRAIRTSLQFSAPVERMRTLLITSPKPEDGKTTVACNLAAALANIGRRVLLVDANFRRPAVTKFFAGMPAEGLSNVLVASGRFADYVAKSELGNLDVLGSGPTPPNPAERLGSPLMRDLLNDALNTYDHVVLDAPPVLLASDASVLATAVDGVILVLRARENSRGVSQRAISLLTHVGAHLFGAVLNAAQVRRGGYFREQLRTYYDYRSEEALTGAEPTGKALPPRPADRLPGANAHGGSPDPSGPADA